MPDSFPCSSKIIIYSEVSWDFLDQRHHHLSRYFAEKGYSVEFVQRVVGRIPSFKRLIAFCYFNFSRLFSNIEDKSNSNKFIPNNIELRKSRFLPHTYKIFSFYNYLVWWFVEKPRQVDSIIYSFVYNPYIIGKNLYHLGKPNKSIFDIIHNWWDFPWKTEIHKKHANFCVTKFDYIVTDSQKIFDKLLRQNIESHLMLPGISKPWLDCTIFPSFSKVKPVFFGNLRTNSDIAFINKIADKFGIDLYGIIDPDVQTMLSDSVNFCGRVDAELLPTVINKYNVVVLPYNNTGFSSSISPAKFYESLASGCTVITRADFSHVAGFEQFCIHFTSLDDVANLNDKLLNRKEIEEQQSFAVKQTWPKRFDALSQFLGISNV